MSFRSFFRSFFTEHLWLKAFSLVLATLIWLTVRSNLEQEMRQESKRLVGQSVALLTDPSERRAFVIDPATVNVTVKGPKTLIDDLTEVHAFVDVASHSGNMMNYNVDVHAPAGVTVVLVSPRSVFVRQVEGQ
jgi:YbbR domain-containing protein